MYIGRLEGKKTILFRRNTSCAYIRWWNILLSNVLRQSISDFVITWSSEILHEFTPHPTGPNCSSHVALGHISAHWKFVSVCVVRGWSKTLWQHPLTSSKVYYVPVLSWKILSIFFLLQLQTPKAYLNDFPSVYMHTTIFWITLENSMSSSVRDKQLVKPLKAKGQMLRTATP